MSIGLAAGQFKGCELPRIPLVSPVAATAVVYVYEKDQGTPPAAVLSALNTLNVDRKIVATPVDRDVKDGNGETPEQYKIPFAEADKAGLPALVVMSGDVAAKVVKAPTTAEQVLEAVP